MLGQNAWKPSSVAEGAPLSSPCWDSFAALCPCLPKSRQWCPILIRSQRNAASESAADVQEISNKSFLIVEVKSAAQTYIRKTGKSLLEIITIPPLSGKSNGPWVKSPGTSSRPSFFSLMHSKYLHNLRSSPGVIPLHWDGGATSQQWQDMMF